MNRVEVEDIAPEEDSDDDTYEPESEGDDSENEVEPKGLSKKVVSGRIKKSVVGKSGTVPLKFDNNNAMARKMSVASSSGAAIRHDLNNEMAQNVTPLHFNAVPADLVIVPTEAPIYFPVPNQPMSTAHHVSVSDRELRSQSLPSSSTTYSRRSHRCTVNFITNFSLYNVRP